METPPPETPENSDTNSTIDASRPFHSVKEAVAVFGTRLHPPSPVPSKPDSSPSSHLASPTYELKLNNNNNNNPEINGSFFGGENVNNSTSSELTKTPNKTSLGDAIKEVVSEPTTPSPIKPKIPYHACTPSSPTPSVSYEMEPLKNEGKTVHGNDLVMMLMLLRKLESELQETKKELKELKERESETEVAVASLNAELHKNMSKIAKAEAAEAGKAAAKSGALDDYDDDNDGGASSRWTNHNNGVIERSNSEVITKQVDSPTLAQILSITDYDCYFQNSNKLKKNMKKKPIIPLITDAFPWRKRSTTSNSYHSASVFSWR